MKDQNIKIFCDGSSSGNPGPGGWGSIIVYPEGGRNEEVIELGGGEKHTTNNRMEIMAVIKALEKIGITDKHLIIYSDSAYMINGITKWVFGWQSRDWQTREKTDVANKDLWLELVKNVKGQKIDWQQVSGHSGIIGNERADEIATAFTKGERPLLFAGEFKKYRLDILNFKTDDKKVAQKSRSGAKAYSYLSLVDGVCKIDSNWADCEKRVKGRVGVKFKKSLSPDDEKEILKSWGVGK